MKKLLFLFITGFIMVSLSGCLTFETKEYSYKLKDGTSGTGKIKYINIMRVDDSTTVIEDDYKDLVNSYLNGSKPEDEMTGVKNVKKRLFEEDNKLCGEITFDFDDLAALKFFKYKDIVWTYNIAPGSFGFFGGVESFFSSNGTYGGEHMPVIFWDAKTKELLFKTTVSQNDKKTISLLEIWKEKGGK